MSCTLTKKVRNELVSDLATTNEAVATLETKVTALETNVNSVVEKDDDYTIDDVDAIGTCVCTKATAMTITLPDATANAGRKLVFIRIGAGETTISSAGDDTISGGAGDLTLASSLDTITIQAFGTNWMSISGIIGT